MDTYTETYGQEPNEVQYDNPKKPNIEKVALTITKTEKTQAYYFIDSTHFEDLYGIDPRYAPSEVVRQYVHDLQGVSVVASNDSSTLVEREVTHTITSCPSELRLPGM